MKGKKILVLAMVAIMALGVAAAQQKNKPGQKPAQKPAAQKPAEEKRIVLGTNQMAGENGKVNLAYTIGIQQPINITLLNAEFSVTRFNVGNQAFAPAKDEKLLVLTYWIHNPNDQITRYDSGTLKFTAVDQENENREGSSQVRREDGTEPLYIDLKPAQKIKVQTVIVVPAKGTVPKLIVHHRSGGAVLRYDLREILKPLPAPFAGEGFDALGEIKAQPEQYMPLMNFDAKYISTQFQERKFGVTTIGDEKVFLAAKFGVKKLTNTGHILRFKMQAVTEDGDRYNAQTIMKGSVEEGASSYAEYGQEMNIRMLVVLPKKARIKQLRFWEDQSKESRVYVYDVDVQFEKPTEPAVNSTPSSTAKNEVSGISADEYTTTYKNSKGETAYDISHVESAEGQNKRTQITAGGRMAILIENLSTGQTTLYFPDTKETFVAPKAQGKEPVTKLSYYGLVYANTAAPKKKSNNLLGNIGKNILGNVASNLGQTIVSGAVLSSFGQASLPQVVNAGVKSQVQGYAVQSFASQLGRAVVTSAMPTEAGGPERVQEQVTVDKNVYVETNFKGKKQIPADTFAFDASQAKIVDATTMFKIFAEYLSNPLNK